MVSSYKAAPDVDVLTSTVSIPAFGSIAVNAFVLHGSEPLLVDTGIMNESDEFMTALRSVIDPADLAWIWLTHTDFDHIGSIHTLLAENSRLRVVTSFLAVGIMSLNNPLPMDRVYLLNPGQTLRAADRTLTGFRPPAFDSPVTTGFHDSESGIVFSSDCFGAMLPAVPESAADLSADELREGQKFWAAADSPWMHNVDPALLAKGLDGIRRMEPTMILSSHLPAAPGSMTDQLLETLAEVPGREPFVGPDQAALEQMMAEMGAPEPA